MFRAPSLGPVDTKHRIIRDLYEAIAVLGIQEPEPTQHEGPQSVHQSESCSDATSHPVYPQNTQNDYEGQQEGFHQLHPSLHPQAHWPYHPLEEADPSQNIEEPEGAQERLDDAVHEHTGHGCYGATNNKYEEQRNEHLRQRRETEQAAEPRSHAPHQATDADGPTKQIDAENPEEQIDTDSGQGQDEEGEQPSPTEVDRLLPGVEQDDQQLSTSNLRRHIQQQNDKEQQQHDSERLSRFQRFREWIKSDTLPQHHQDAQLRFGTTTVANTVGPVARHEQRRTRIFRERMLETWLEAQNRVGLGTQGANGNQPGPRWHQRRWFIPPNSRAPGGGAVSQTLVPAVPPQNNNAPDPAANQDDDDAQAPHNAENRDNA